MWKLCWLTLLCCLVVRSVQPRLVESHQTNERRHQRRQRRKCTNIYMYKVHVHDCLRVWRARAVCCSGGSVMTVCACSCTSSSTSTSRWSGSRSGTIATGSRLRQTLSRRWTTSCSTDALTSIPSTRTTTHSSSRKCMCTVYMAFSLTKVHVNKGVGGAEIADDILVFSYIHKL